MSTSKMYRDKQWLYHQYIELEKSRTEIAAEVGVNKQTVWVWLKKHGIKRTPPPNVEKYNDREWLFNQYVTLRKTDAIIAEENGWSTYAVTHARQGFLIKQTTFMDDTLLNYSWMYRQCVELRRSEADIAREVGVCQVTVNRYKNILGIDSIPRVTIEDAKKLAIDRGGECLSDTYVGTHDNLVWKCGECSNIWLASYHNIAGGAWCPTCATSQYKHEDIFRSVMEYVFCCAFQKQKPDWLRNPGTGYPLEIDGYNEEIKCGYEYQGRQHEVFVSRFHRSIKDLEYQQERDAIKAKILSERGIFMLYPTYKLKEKDYYNFIIDAIEREYGPKTQ